MRRVAERSYGLHPGVQPVGANLREGSQRQSYSSCTVLLAFSLLLSPHPAPLLTQPDQEPERKEPSQGVQTGGLARLTAGREG